MIVVAGVREVRRLVLLAIRRRRSLAEAPERRPHPTPADRTTMVAIVTPMADRTFAKFTFFKIDPEWRRRDAELRAIDKQEFLAACEDFASTARSAPTQP